MTTLALVTLPLHLARAPWNPDYSLFSITAGLLLIYLECNRPGRVVPGALGLLLLLLGLNALLRTPLRSIPTALLPLPAVVLSSPLWRRTGWFTVLAGVTLLAVDFATLSALRPVSLLAGACGLLLGTVSGYLVLIASRARREKRQIIPGSLRSDPLRPIDRWE